MRKSIFCGAGLALLAVASSASAKDKLDKRVATALECSGMADAGARLACYDTAIGALKSAVEGGEIDVSERQRPRTMEGVVKAAGMVSDTNFWVELDNGDRWRLRPSSWRKQPPAVGVALKIRKGVGGLYWISGPGWRTSEADFEGHKD